MTKYYKSRIFRNTVAAGAMALAIGVTASPAFAEKSARLNSMSFTTRAIYDQAIHVISTNGEIWDKLKSGSFFVGTHVNIDTKWPGWVVRVGIVLGNCGGSSCGKPLLWSHNVADRDYEVQRALSISTSSIPVSSDTGIATVPYGNQMIAVCNEHLSNDGPTKSYSFTQEMNVSFVADTHNVKYPSEVTASETLWASDVDHSVFTSFSIKVVCDPIMRSPVGDLAVQEPKDLKVTSVELFRTTYSHAVSKPNPGTVCKKARLLVRLKTNKEGPVQFRLWKKIGDGPFTSEFHEAWSSFSGPGQYQAEYSEWVEVSKTTSIMAKAEELVSGFNGSSPWKSITLHCTGAGGGGFADAPNTSNPDNNLPTTPLKVTGELTLADKADAPEDKPRLGAAVFKLVANKPGNTAYKLTCTGGREWTGTLPTFKIGTHKYQGVGQHNFQIDKTELIGCAVRSTSLANNAVVALATKQFLLVKRNPSVGAGPNDFQDAPRPSQASKPRDLKKQRAEQIAKRKEAVKKVAERKRRADAQKAAAERKRRAAAKKVVAERKRRAVARKAASPRRKRIGSTR